MKRNGMIMVSKLNIYFIKFKKYIQLYIFHSFVYYIYISTCIIVIIIKKLKNINIILQIIILYKMKQQLIDDILCDIQNGYPL